jgi:hypothetical protein
MKAKRLRIDAGTKRELQKRIVDLSVPFIFTPSTTGVQLPCTMFYRREICNRWHDAHLGATGAPGPWIQHTFLVTDRNIRNGCLESGIGFVLKYAYAICKSSQDSLHARHLTILLCVQSLNTVEIAKGHRAFHIVRQSLQLLHRRRIPACD